MLMSFTGFIELGLFNLTIIWPPLPIQKIM